MTGARHLQCAVAGTVSVVIHGRLGGGAFTPNNLPLKGESAPVRSEKKKKTVQHVHMYNKMRTDVISSHTHQPLEEGKVLCREAFREQVYRILVSRDLDKVNRLVLNDPTYEVIPHLNVFRLRMEARILG